MKKRLIITLMTIIMLSFYGCKKNSDTEAADVNASAETAETAVSDSTTESTTNSSSVDSTFTPLKSDTDTDWDASATQITLSDDSATVSGAGAAADGSTITISKAGVYVLSGTLTDGKIVISATKTDDVRIVLNGVDITNQTGSAINGESVSKLTLTLASGSKNRVADGGRNFQYTDTTEEEPNAAIFSKNDLTVNGTGQLTVQADFKNGVGAKDSLVIISGTLIVNAANNALRGTDSVTIVDGTLSLTAQNDGIQTGTNLNSKGNMQLDGGDITIVSGNDGIQSDNALTISGGKYSIQSGSLSGQTTGSSSDSYKGIKAAALLTISGGTFSIESTDDSIHAGGNIIVKKGTLQLSSEDDGIHSDADLKISGGSVTVTESYEALEGTNIYISGGTMNLTASDDGINAAGGSDNGTDGGNVGFGKDQFSGGGDHTIDISGGTINFYAGGDGLDSNNTINISGGTVAAIINSSADNSALDSDGEVTITGGIVVAGGTGSFESISSNSSQSYVYLTNISAGSKITVESGSKTLAAYTAEQSLDCVTVFAPGITSGQSYDVSVGSSSSSVTAGTGGGRSMGGPGGMGRPGGMW